LRTTLKRGIGRGAGLNGNGYATLPPGALTPMARYRQPPPSGGHGFAWRFGRFLLWLLVIVLMIAGGAAGGLYLYTQDFGKAIGPKTKAMKEAVKNLDYVSPDKPAVALLMGSDHRYIDGKDPGRSDTLMLIRTDPASETVSMLSFPRDLQVEIHCPGHPTWVDKINAAYGTCGPIGALDTVKALTNVPVNYLINVNFIGFIQVVNKLGGVYIDVDRRYFNNHTGPFGYAAINLQPGYQKLTGKEALSFVRYRHTDSDLFRVARQQIFVRAAKERLAVFAKWKVLHLAKTIKENVEVGRGGGKSVDPTTLWNYAQFFRHLPGGHFNQVRIQGLEGYANLTTAPQNVTNAIQQFMNPDPTEPEKANAAALNEKYKPKVTGIKPASIFVTVLNGNGQTGAASVAGTQLKERGYQLLQPPDALSANAPGGFNYPTSKVYYDTSLPRAKAAAKQVAKLFGNAPTGVMSQSMKPYANGALLVVVVGKTYTGSLTGTRPVTEPIKHRPPHTTRDPGATLSLMRSIKRRVPFRLEYPTVIDRTSRVDNEPPNPRVYSLSGHKAVRLVFSTGVPGQFWGIEETNWSAAPALSEKNFHRHFGRRRFDFYYSGAHLHMVVLREHGATYWVVNTLDDALSNETMIAIARGLRPLS
jgi:LCP family protein required for cell wall assembly